MLSDIIITRAAKMRSIRDRHVPGDDTSQEFMRQVPPSYLSGPYKPNEYLGRSDPNPVRRSYKKDPNSR